MPVSLFWFRRDLRIDDNTAFSQALKGEYPVQPIFIFDSNILNELPEDDARVSFIYETLHSLNNQFLEYNSSVLILHGDPLKVWENLIQSFTIEKVYINKDYEPYALQRDQKIKDFLSKEGIELIIFKDQVIFEESEVVKDDGNPYTVFTPYKKKWLQRFSTEDLIETDNFDFNNLHKNFHEFPELESIGFRRSSIKVKPYTLQNIDSYAEERNSPALDSTSYLSPHLRFGTVSIREIIRKLNSTNEVFLSELIWREFFMQILFHFPHVVNQSFKAKYDSITWRNNPVEFEKWCKGLTGYPMVDAGMRQLNQTGYMHNRVRMVTASFLCKHLLIDWRWGEAYFAEKLLDYELSSNNGNWQWAAGTGCDAAPYFRVFNPITQREKFDKELIYVKKWIPEFGTDKYPEPMVEHKKARIRALDTYKTGLAKFQISN